VLKAIFWIAVFFFFISVLFYGIRFIFITLMNFANSSKPNQSTKLIGNKGSTFSNMESLKPEKCYEEHQQLWIKLISLGQGTSKTIKVNNISMVENLLTKERLSNEKSIEQYFKRFS